MYQGFRVENKNDGVCILTLSKPEVLNALCTQTFQELNDFFDRALTDTAIRVLIITGEGRGFAAGADLSECREAGIEENRSYAELAQNTLARLGDLPFPVIAAVNGYALGGGCELAMACDLRIASEKAKFGMPETGLGVIPCFGGTQMLPRLVGMGRAKEMIFTGRTIGAQEALEIGLAEYVTAPEELMQKAEDIAGQIAVKSPTALKYAKVALSASQGLSPQQGLELERNLSAICYGLPDKEEGMQAFAQKRKPVYSNR